MQRYSASETHFALMTVAERRSAVLEAEISSLTSQLEAIDLASSSSSGDDASELLSRRESALAEIANLRTELADENSKLIKQVGGSVNFSLQPTMYVCLIRESAHD
jgi:ElaB/YqjD/DUF883 family membrane-anchored ribosome-binding protein